MSVQHVENIYRKRHSFSKIRSLVPIPNLIDIQKQSYDEFLQMNLLHEERDPRGLKTVFDAMWKSGKSADAIIEEQGLKQVSDGGAIETIIAEVLADNPAQVDIAD